MAKLATVNQVAFTYVKMNGKHEGASEIRAEYAQ